MALEQLEQVQRTIAEQGEADKKFVEDLAVRLEEETALFMKKIADMDAKMLHKLQEISKRRVLSKFNAEESLQEFIEAAVSSCEENHQRIAKFLRGKDEHTVRIIKIGDSAYLNKLLIRMVTAVQRGQEFDVTELLKKRDHSRLVMITSRRIKTEARRKGILESEELVNTELVERMEGKNIDSDSDSDSD